MICFSAMGNQSRLRFPKALFGQCKPGRLLRSDLRRSDRQNLLGGSSIGLVLFFLLLLLLFPFFCSSFFFPHGSFSRAPFEVLGSFEPMSHLRVGNIYEGSKHAMSSLHGCCWETFYISAYCGLVGTPHLTAKKSPPSNVNRVYFGHDMTNMCKKHVVSDTNLSLPASRKKRGHFWGRAAERW